MWIVKWWRAYDESYQNLPVARSCYIFELSSGWETVWLPLFRCYYYCYCFFLLLLFLALFLASFDFVMFGWLVYFFSLLILFFFHFCLLHFSYYFSPFFNKYICILVHFLLLLFPFEMLVRSKHTHCCVLCVFCMGSWLFEQFSHFIVRFFFLGHDYNNTHECLTMQQISWNIPWIFSRAMDFQLETFLWTVFDSTQIQWENVIFGWGFPTSLLLRQQRTAN